jgi:hypothetical protein
MEFSSLSTRLSCYEARFARFELVNLHSTASASFSPTRKAGSDPVTGYPSVILFKEGFPTNQMR